MSKHIDILEYTQEGYAGVLTYDKWKVAMLNYIDELEPQHINNFQAHLKTDEAFILLQGQCILFTGEKHNDTIITIEAHNMEPHKVYNVKKGVYHTHTLSNDAKVLIVENANTGDKNSPKIKINKTINDQLVQLTTSLWK